jgi:ubiquitin-protein ligase
MYSGMKKRVLLHELGELEKNYTKIQINIETESPIHDIPRKTNIIDIILCDPIKEILPRTMRFVLENYPFKSPVVHVNNKPYKIDCCNIPKVTKKFHAYNPPEECLHCSFITKNWSPVMRMEDIILQIEKIQYIKRNIKYEFAIDRLKLPQDINDIIFSFLFTEKKDDE